jgi:hypothetical protein
MFFCSYGCTAGARTAPPLVRVGCSRRFARLDTLLDDPNVAANTPAVDSEVRNSYLLFIYVSL